MLLLYFYEQKLLTQIRFTLKMHPIYGDKCFAKQTVHIWCKNAEWAEICMIYRGATSRSSVAWTAVLCIEHSEVR